MRCFLGASLAILIRAMAPTSAVAEGTGKAIALPAVTVIQSAKRDIVETMIVTGTLVPRDEILVTPEIDGYRIIDVLVEEGAKVERGQVLARLSRELIDQQIIQQKANIDKAAAAVPQAENNIEQAEAAHIETRLSFERATQLMSSGNATAVTMEARTSALRQAEGRAAFARNGLASAKAELEQAKAVGDELNLRLARTEIRAPEAGVVSRRSARIGMAASAAAEPLFRLIARGEIELEGDVIETKLPSMRAGQLAWVEFEDGERIQGRIRAVYPEVERATRLGKIRIRLDPHPRLRIGTFAKGGVETDRGRGVTVPRGAVSYDGSQTSILVVSAGSVQRRDVQTGIQNDDDILIREGLSEGEAVVLRAGSFLRDGDRVRAVLAKPTATASAAGDRPSVPTIELQ